MADYTKQTGSCVATDPFGNEITIIEFTDFVETRSGPQPTFKSYETDNGDPVTFISKGRYRLAVSGIKLISDNPDAL